jgi:hypothetical protein
MSHQLDTCADFCILDTLLLLSLLNWIFSKRSRICCVRARNGNDSRMVAWEQHSALFCRLTSSGVNIFTRNLRQMDGHMNCIWLNQPPTRQKIPKFRPLISMVKKNTWSFAYLHLYLYVESQPIVHSVTSIPIIHSVRCGALGPWEESKVDFAASLNIITLPPPFALVATTSAVTSHTDEAFSFRRRRASKLHIIHRFF